MQCSHIKLPITAVRTDSIKVLQMKRQTPDRDFIYVLMNMNIISNVLISKGSLWLPACGDPPVTNLSMNGLLFIEIYSLRV